MQFDLPPPSTQPNTNPVNGTVFKHQIKVPGTCANIAVGSIMMDWGVRYVAQDEAGDATSTTIGADDGMSW
jgi:hypothetical protein